MESGPIWSCPVTTSEAVGKKPHRTIFPLNRNKHFFTVRVLEQWHRLPKEVVESLWRYSKAIWM